MAKDSYDDESLRQFAAATGLHLHGRTPKARERFAARYKWAERQRMGRQWLDWRADAITALNMKIRDAVYYGSDETLKYYLFDGDYIFPARPAARKCCSTGRALWISSWRAGSSPQGLCGSARDWCMSMPSPSRGPRLGRIIAPWYGLPFWKLDKSLSAKAVRNSPEAAALHNTGPDRGAHTNFHGFIEPYLASAPNASWYWEDMLQVGLFVAVRRACPRGLRQLDGHGDARADRPHMVRLARWSPAGRNTPVHLSKPIARCRLTLTPKSTGRRLTKPCHFMCQGRDTRISSIRRRGQ